MRSATNCWLRSSHQGISSSFIREPFTSSSLQQSRKVRWESSTSLGSPASEGLGGVASADASSIPKCSMLIGNKYRRADSLPTNCSIHFHSLRFGAKRSQCTCCRPATPSFSPTFPFPIVVLFTLKFRGKAN